MDDRVEISGLADVKPAVRPSDRRIQRTRVALRLAFNELVLARGYDTISAADIAEHANIGRSTFYEHYQGKEDVLAQSLATLLGPLADSRPTETAGASVEMVAEHFWQNRKLAKALMSGPARRVMVRILAGLIESRLTADLRTRDQAAILPVALCAIQLAHGQLALIEEWLSGRHGCTATQIAAALRATSDATTRMLAGV